MRIPRIYDNLERYLKPNKVLVIFGPRQVGKTTLLRDFLKSKNTSVAPPSSALAAHAPRLKYRFDSGDNIQMQNLLSSQNFEEIKNYAKGYELIIIDEAQRIKNVGLGLKILVDQVPRIKVIATGSSSFELAGQVGEPLTGRKNVLTLFPISQIELNKMYNNYDLKNKLEEFLIYGAYPEVITAQSTSEKKGILNEICGSYLFKDILELERVKSSKILLDLLRLLAFQVGNEVSLTELSRELGIDSKTIARYLDLFEKAFVLYNLRGFSRNLREEITRTSKYYFYDNGIRNAIIANFNPLELRDDIGKLWENFLISERLKKQAYTNIYANNYFWRTWSQEEIDFVEEREGKLFAFEFKWKKSNNKQPASWVKNYPKAIFKIIDKNNYQEFIM